MQGILIVSTGGTFNKIYNPITGVLEIDEMSSSILDISSKWQIENMNLVNIISKDSLDMTNEDRELLLQCITDTEYKKIIVIHGTDTMEISADLISKNINKKSVVFTGAMVPFSVDKVEATANLASAVGFLLGTPKDGVFIAMNGINSKNHLITKNRGKGLFILKES